MSVLSALLFFYVGRLVGLCFFSVQGGNKKEKKEEGRRAEASKWIFKRGRSVPAGREETKADLLCKVFQYHGVQKSKLKKINIGNIGCLHQK
jgi:hypothetical protein